MKITYIIFLTTCLSLHCFGENNNGKTVSSEYSYRIEYNDSDNGNYGHKLEVKDGKAKLDVRSENSETQKFNSVRQTKSFVPQKKPVVPEKPKEDITYIPSATAESSTITPSGKNTLSYAAPQVPVQIPRNEAYNSALQKYSQEQLSILLSQNKNPFLPLNPKDTISQFLSKYVSPQSSQGQQSHAGYTSQIQNNYQYQPQSYAQTPSVSTETKSQYPASYYSPSIPQQNSGAQQVYYQPQVQYSYPSSPNSHLQQNTATASHYPQTQSVPQTQSAVQYVYVPQTSSQSASHSPITPQQYRTSQTGLAQFSQQSYNNEALKQQYTSPASYQSNQLTYNVPKIPSGQSYPTSLYSEYASSIPQTSAQGKQQYASVPSSSAYQGTQALYNIASTTASQPTQPSYQNAYPSSSGSQYPAVALSSSQLGPATFKSAAPTQTSSIYQNAYPSSAGSQYPAASLSSSQLGPATFKSAAPTQTSSLYQNAYPSSAGSQYPSASLSSSQLGPATFKSAAPTQTSSLYQNAYSSSAGSQYPAIALSSSQYKSAAPAQISSNNFEFNKYPQFGATQSSTLYSSQQAAAHSPSTAQYNSAVPSNSGASAYGQALNTAGASVQDPSKSNIFGSNINFGQLFSGSQSLFSGGAGLKIQDAIKSPGNVQLSQISAPSYGSNLNQGQQAHAQLVNSASSTNYKPVVEQQAPDTSTKVQYQPAAVNSILGSNNFDISKFQFPGLNLENIQSNYQFTSGSNLNLKQISNVQASDNKYGQYAIDFRQGTNPAGAAQVMVHTNYNLGAQNLQSPHGSVPVSAASDNSNVKYVYVPSYVPSSSQGHNQQ